MSLEISKKFYQSVANKCKTSTEPMFGSLPGVTLYEWLQESDPDTLLELSAAQLAAEWDSLNESDNA